MASNGDVKVSFKEQMLALRAEAIVQSVRGLLADKGFEAMTVDEVAVAVGIAKASLYKHFSSKEELAAQAVLSVLRDALGFMRTLSRRTEPLAQLEAMLRWALQLRLRGGMPALPSRTSRLWTTLAASAHWNAALAQIRTQLDDWIKDAQAQGSLDPQLDRSVVLLTLYARAFDPALDFLKQEGALGDQEIMEFLLNNCLDGLKAHQQMRTGLGTGTAR
jgi:AcrR family transcriptional regulator